MIRVRRWVNRWLGHWRLLRQIRSAEHELARTVAEYERASQDAALARAMLAATHGQKPS